MIPIDKGVPLPEMMKKPTTEEQRLRELESAWKSANVSHIYDKQEVSRGKCGRTLPKPRLDEIEAWQK